MYSSRILVVLQTHHCVLFIDVRICLCFCVRIYIVLQLQLLAYSSYVFHFLRVLFWQSFCMSTYDHLVMKFRIACSFAYRTLSRAYLFAEFANLFSSFGRLTYSRF